MSALGDLLRLALCCCIVDTVVSRPRYYQPQPPSNVVYVERVRSKASKSSLPVISCASMVRDTGPQAI